MEYFHMVECEKVKAILPLGFESITTYFKYVEEDLCYPSAPNLNSFEATVRIKIDNETGVKNWFEAFQNRNLVTYRVMSANPVLGKSVLYKKSLYCQHGISRSNHKYKSKKTGCLSRITLTLKKIVEKSRSKDTFMPQWPCIVHIRWTHNHPLNVASALKYRDIGQPAIERLKILFHEGHSHATALRCLSNEIQARHGNQFSLASCDRKILPKYGDVSMMHRTFEKNYSKFNGGVSLSTLAEGIKSLFEGSDTMIKIEVMETHMVAAMLTPLMERVQTHHSPAGELLFIDSRGFELDTYTLHVFVLLTSSSVGSLPLGCFMTTSKSKSVIESGLRALTSLLPVKAFNGRGLAGPKAIMTENSLPIKQSFKAVFPGAKQFLCIFQLMQDTWRYLWNNARNDRLHLLKLMQGVLSSSDWETLTTKWQEASNDKVLSHTKSKSVKAYFQSLWLIKEQWALYNLKSINVCVEDTNLAETVFLTMKDTILRHLKASNAVHLMDSIYCLSNYYTYKINEKNRLPLPEDMTTSVGDSIGSLDGDTPSKHIKKGAIFVGDNLYTMCGKSGKFYVNALLSLCSCNIGISGTPCKHLLSVRSKYGLDFLRSMPVVNESEMAYYNRIVTGSDISHSCSLPVSEANTLCHEKDDAFGDLFNLYSPVVEVIIKNTTNTTLRKNDHAREIPNTSTTLCTGNDHTSETISSTTNANNDHASESKSTSSPTNKNHASETISTTTTTNNDQHSESTSTALRTYNEHISETTSKTTHTNNDRITETTSTTTDTNNDRITETTSTTTETNFNSETESPPLGIDNDHASKVLSQLEQFFNGLKEKVIAHPETLLEPVSKFSERGNKLLSSSLPTLSKGLSNFGFSTLASAELLPGNRTSFLELPKTSSFLSYTNINSNTRKKRKINETSKKGTNKKPKFDVRKNQGLHASKIPGKSLGLII